MSKFFFVLKYNKVREFIMKLLKIFLRSLASKIGVSNIKKNTRHRAREIISNDRLNTNKVLSVESANCEEW